jgi:WD40 repeat protein
LAGGRWPDATARYEQAVGAYAGAGESALRADAALADAYRHARPPLLRLAGHAGAVRCVAASPDGELIASGGEDQTVRLAAVAAAAGGSGETPVPLPLAGHGDPVRAVCFSPDGRRLISVSRTTGRSASRKFFASLVGVPSARR